MGTAEPLSRAVCSKAPADVLYCLVKELGADVNRRNKEDWTALQAAAALDHHDTARFLVEELGADVNVANNGGQTPLWIAASQGHLEVVRLLLKLRADINRANISGLTPLMMATSQKHHEVVTWLVKAGADTQAVVGHDTAADISREVRASAEQTAYLEAKTHCSSPGCGGAGIMKCTGCRQARYCGEVCQLAHWKAHKADCKRWSAELKAEKREVD